MTSARILAILIVSIALESRAAIFEPMTFERLADEAEQVFIGTASAAQSGLTFQRQIVTDFTFIHIEVVKGEVLGEETKIRMLGGVVGDISLKVPGAPTFQIGSRYVVFVRNNGKVVFPTLGGPQGIFQVRLEQAGEVVYDYYGRSLEITKQSFVRAVQQRVEIRR